MLTKAQIEFLDAFLGSDGDYTQMLLLSNQTVDSALLAYIIRKALDEPEVHRFNTELNQFYQYIYPLKFQYFQCVELLRILKFINNLMYNQTISINLDEHGIKEHQACDFYLGRLSSEPTDSQKFIKALHDKLRSDISDVISQFNKIPSTTNHKEAMGRLSGSSYWQQQFETPQNQITTNELVCCAFENNWIDAYQWSKLGDAWVEKFCLYITDLSFANYIASDETLRTLIGILQVCALEKTDDNFKKLKTVLQDPNVEYAIKNKIFTFADTKRWSCEQTLAFGQAAKEGASSRQEAIAKGMVILSCRTETRKSTDKLATTLLPQISTGRTKITQSLEITSMRCK